MPSDPTKLQKIVPATAQLTTDRFSVATLRFGPLLDAFGAPINLQSDTTFSLWVSPPDPSAPLAVVPQPYTPILPILWTPGGSTPYTNNVYLQLFRDDYDFLGFFTGSMQVQLLCSRDAGVTIEEIGKAVLSLAPYLTLIWT